jgi:hypothetical protein
MAKSTSAALGVLLLFLAGCEAEPNQLVPVRGKVYYRQIPVGNGIIVFTPDSARNCEGPIAHAEIQPDGSFVLRTGEEPGALPGWHRVTISSHSPLIVTGGRQPFVLPAHYSDPEQSGLSFEIKAQGENTFTISLE